MIQSKIIDDRFERPFQRVIQGMQDATPLMRVITGIMLDEVEENFEQEGRPEWLGLHPGTIAARKKAGHWPGKILQRTGQLAASIVGDHDATSSVVGTNKEYAAAHQFGAKTRPHVIKPRNKKALAFGGTVTKKVNHPGSEIPARPFLVISESGNVAILSATNRYLRGLIR